MAIDPEDLQICLSADAHSETDPSPISHPIVQTSLFSFATYEDLIAGLGDEYRNPVYTRGRNPTISVLEDKLARLERGESCKVFASGMSAISSTVFGLAQQGDHIVFVNHRAPSARSRRTGPRSGASGCVGCIRRLSMTTLR